MIPVTGIHGNCLNKTQSLLLCVTKCTNAVVFLCLTDGLYLQRFTEEFINWHHWYVSNVKQPLLPLLPDCEPATG